MAGHPLRPATDRRLGKPLPYQLANQTQAVPKAHKALLRRAHAVLDTISGAYPSLWGTFLRVTQPSAARVLSHIIQPKFTSLVNTVADSIPLKVGLI